MKQIAEKFVAWSVPALETLKQTRVYRLRVRINQGERMTRDEKNWLTQAINQNAYSKSGIPLAGWMFNCTDVLHRYWVMRYGDIDEFYATDKTALRQILHGRILKIVEIK
jgi:hypothetical protein